MRSSTQEEHDQMMEFMRQIAFQPKIGFFCYDAVNNALFGVDDYDVDYKWDMTECHNGFIMCRHSEASFKDLYLDPFYSYDNYLTAFRGEVHRSEDGSFSVIVDTWFKEFPQARDVILERFHLLEDAEFKIVKGFDHPDPNNFRITN